MVCKRFPRIKIVTSEIEGGLNDDFRVVPGMGEFGDRYFGTDEDWTKSRGPSIPRDRTRDAAAFYPIQFFQNDLLKERESDEQWWKHLM